MRLKAMCQFITEWIEKVNWVEILVRTSFFILNYILKRYSSLVYKKRKPYSNVQDIVNYLMEASENLFENDNEIYNNRSCMLFYSGLCERCDYFKSDKNICL